MAADDALVLGTAGHIDHGKSTLVKALTGVDPDRLAEEKRRGMTIELGFARLDLPSGRSLGVVDVPGHERFVRQMVAGASGIDLVLLVVAADDGVMPQTREHLAVIDLLGIDRGVVAVTKSDLVDAEWLALVAEDVRSLLEGTSLAGSPIVPVSGRTGAGLPELLEALDATAASTSGRRSEGAARLPVDRVFTIAGAGTVVTGTLWGGHVRVGDTLKTYPGGVSARVRAVQVHDAPVAEARAGNRVAVNLVGVETSEIARGDVLAEPGSLVVTDRFDARMLYLGDAGKPLKSGTRVHVSHGTRDVLGTVLLLDGVHEAQPGQRVWAQLRLDHPLAPRYGDRFILRSQSATATIGGGEVLDVSPPRRTTLRPTERDVLEALAEHDVTAASLGLVGGRSLPQSARDVASALGMPEAEVAAALAGAPLVARDVGGETLYFEPARFDTLVRSIGATLAAFHEAQPRATGLTIGALRDAVDPRITARAFDPVLVEAVRRGLAVVDHGEVRDPAAASGALAAGDAAAEQIAGVLESQGLAPDTLPELTRRVAVDPAVTRKAMTRLESEGRVVRVASDLYFSAEAVAGARTLVEEHIRANGPMLASEARDLLGTSRKFVVPLLEHFDAQGVTKREGDARVLRRPD